MTVTDDRTELHPWRSEVYRVDVSPPFNSIMWAVNAAKRQFAAYLSIDYKDITARKMGTDGNTVTVMVVYTP